MWWWLYIYILRLMCLNWCHMRSSADDAMVSNFVNHELWYCRMVRCFKCKAHMPHVHARLSYQTSPDSSHSQDLSRMYRVDTRFTAMTWCVCFQASRHTATPRRQLQRHGRNNTATVASDSSDRDQQGEEVVVPLPTISPSHVDAVIHHDYAARESPRSLKRKLGDANEMLAFARKKFYVANKVTKRLKKQIKDLN